MKIVPITIVRLLALALAVLPGVMRAQNLPKNIEQDPAYLAIDQHLDLKAVKPEVNISLPRFLLLDAVSEFNGGTNDPLAQTGIRLADLVKDVKLIRVVVIRAEKGTNRTVLTDGIRSLRKTLDASWNPIVSVPEEGVGIYAHSDPSGERMNGLALVVHQPRSEAVIANIVGHVSISKILQIATRMDKLPKDLLKKLAQPQPTGGALEKAEPAAEKPANKSAETPLAPAK